MRTESGNFRHDEQKDKLMTHTHLPEFLVIFKEFFKGFARNSILVSFKLLGPEVLERKEIAVFVCFESEEHVHQAAGRSRFCSVTVHREENKDAYNWFKCKIGKWLF